MNLQEDCGRLFEAGFMLGAVRALKLLPRRPPMLATYEQERALFPVHTVIERFVQHTAGAAGHEAAATLARSWLLRGHLCGLTFMREYTDALVTRAGSGSFTINDTQQRLALRYWQCSLRGSNQLLEPSREERDAERTMWLAQLGQDLACTTRADRTRGGFLNADLLLFFTHQGTGTHELLALDCSAFAGTMQSSGRALSGPDELLDLLQAEAAYHAGHGGIARATIDATLAASGLFDAGLSPYLAAFAHSDKETCKLIQAAAYAHSALTYLERNGVLGHDERIRVTVVGYTSYEVNSMVLERGQRAILAACSTIYRQARTAVAGPPVEREPAAARTRLLEVIARSAGELFPGADHFLATLQDAIRDGTRAGYDEQLPAFQNTAGAVSRPVLRRCALRTPGLSQPRRPPDTRSAHAALVFRALAAQWRFVFLTGNPGIGKTTAVARYLMEECHREGYVLLYASPRTLVNQDIFGRFRSADGESFYSTQWIGLTTNRAVIETEGTAAVYYTGAAARLPHVPAGVRYVPWPVDPQDDPPRRPMSRLVRGAEDVIGDRRRGAPGVVSTLCRGIHGVLSTRETNAVVAAFSIQALRRTETGDTLKHLALIFGDAYQERLGGFLEPPMRALAATTRHVVVMIDEITGDPAGHAFLRLMAATLAAWRLEQYGFRVSIVVADASLTGKDVVGKHLDPEQREPDARKIYLTLRPARGKIRQPDPIAIESFRFTAGSPGEPDDACLITAHSFPATALRMRYRVRVQAREIPAGCTGAERRALGAIGKLDDALDADIAEDVCEALVKTPGEQILVFVQHKRRLQRIIDRIGEAQRTRGETFTLEEDYLPIHADVPRRQLELLRNDALRDRFRVFFVTSSASRGLTFPRVRHIFVEVPRFHTETNLMEIVQVIYRGRGGALDHGERTITAYLSGQVLAPEGRLDEYVRDSTADLITALVLVKLAIVSRIRGGMVLRRRWISLVPVGGKSVAGSDWAFHHELAHLRRAVIQEMTGPRRHDFRLQAILTAVTALTATARIQVDRQPGSLLQVIDACSADQRRLEEWLCADDPVQPAYVCGSLLLVPISHAATTHLITLQGTRRVVLSEETRRAVRHVLRHHHDYTAALVQGVRALRALQSTLQDAQRSQYLEHHGVLRDTYYAIPLAVFTAREAIRAWCVHASQAQDGAPATAMRDALQDVLQEVYPLDTILPIGPTYEDFPFLVITSQDLRAMRATIFRRGSILVSPEMNLLALILAREERQGAK